MTIGRVTVKGGFLLLMAILFYFDTTGVILWMLPAAALHELGHLLALRLFGVHAEVWTFSLRGVEMRLPDWPTLSYGRDFVATLAGPLFSLLGAFVAARLAGSPASGLYVLSGMAYVQGLFNLLPAKSLDGGRLLRLALSRFFGEGVADRALVVSTAVCAGLLLIAGVLAYAGGRQNLVLLLTSVYLALSILL